jgi:hypothetical protein
MLAVAATVIVGVGCGAEDFANDPRPPAPIQLSARVGPDDVRLSPNGAGGQSVGAGLASFTISNQTDSEVSLTFVGPSEQRTAPIVSEGEMNYQIDLLEGTYVVATDDPTIDDAELRVGPERPSAQNDLLLP